ncbi:uncharacterized protein LOC122944676 [Bufo gargarizans]|uniref:uncharacterized protein LOC122944676 n=1 Tax=Bufo gargarizans TaxID=30331 RepID=UPI001CF56B1E|nr:uncharacterized protein LOC122944676 [Bufo gargarizans]
MAVIFKMKFFLVWICLISEAFPFATHSPEVNDTEGCCGQNTKLIYKGHDSNSGINIYVFEYTPQSKEAKDGRVEDTTMKNDLQSSRNALKDTENGENHEDTIIQTTKPTSIYGRNKDPDTGTGNKPDWKFDTIISTEGETQNDIEMYENTDLLSNATEGLQSEMSHTRDVQKTSGHSNRDDYYGTEGSAVLDIPAYYDTNTGTQGPQVYSTPNIDLKNNLGCSESEGQCKNPTKSTERVFVTQPTIHKDYSKRRTRPDYYGNRDRKTMNRTVKPAKTRVHKSDKQTNGKKSDKQTNGKKSDKQTNGKVIPISHIIRKIFQNRYGQRRKTGGYRHISSESRSDSSQEFD